MQFKKEVDRIPIIIEHLVLIVRNIGMCRATKEQNNLNFDFYSLIQGGFLDLSVLEWCKVFTYSPKGNEYTYWKKLIEPEHHDDFEKELIKLLEINEEIWSKYIEDMKLYRNSMVSHHKENYKDYKNKPRSSHYPNLEIALKSSCYYHALLTRYFKISSCIFNYDNLENYFNDFMKQTLKIMQISVAATKNIEKLKY
jgi:hypothetical protein